MPGIVVVTRVRWWGPDFRGMTWCWVLGTRWVNIFCRSSLGRERSGKGFGGMDVGGGEGVGFPGEGSEGGGSVGPMVKLECAGWRICWCGS